MPTVLPTIPPDDREHNLTLAQPENLPHIGLVGDTYTITLTGDDTAGRFCVIDMHIPPGGGPPPHRHDFEETFILLEGEVEANLPRQEVDRARWRHAEHSCQRSPSVSQRFNRAGTYALYLFSSGTGKILHGGWGTGRDAYDTPAEARRKGAGRIH